jgi:hypothetical protein
VRFLVVVGVIVTACRSSTPAPAPTSPRPTPSETRPATPTAPAEPDSTVITVAIPDTAPPSDRPASITDADLATLEQMRVLARQLTTDLIRAGKDCKQAAMIFDAAAPTIAPFGPMMMRLIGDSAASEWISKHFTDETMTKVMTDLSKACGNDQRFTRATMAFARAVMGS